MNSYRNNQRNNHRNNRRGYILVALMLLTALVPVLMLAAERISRVVAYTNDTTLSSLTRSQMDLVKLRLVTTAGDPDTDMNRETLAPNGADGLPLSLGVNSKDQWGSELRYCPWDLGGTNVDAAYARFAVLGAPPVANLTFRLVSPGRDKTLQTACADVAGGGDDLVVDVYQGEIATLLDNLSLKKLDYTVAGAAVTQIDFTGLDSSTDGDYLLDFSLSNPTGSVAYVSLYVNNDTNELHYYNQMVKGDDVAVTAARANNAFVTVLQPGGTASGTIRASAKNGEFSASVTSRRKSGSSVVLWHGEFTSTESIAAVTQLTLVADVAGALGVGSTVNLSRTR